MLCVAASRAFPASHLFVSLATAPALVHHYVSCHAALAGLSVLILFLRGAPIIFIVGHLVVLSVDIDRVHGVYIVTPLTLW